MKHPPFGGPELAFPFHLPLSPLPLPCSPLRACPRKRQALQILRQKIGGSCLPPGHASPKIGGGCSPPPPRQISQNCSWAYTNDKQSGTEIATATPPLKPHGEQTLRFPRGPAVSRRMASSIDSASAGATGPSAPHGGSTFNDSASSVALRIRSCHSSA